jgi:glucosamine--fructose-6-phosphate aminotransferase (isomerizing)
MLSSTRLYQEIHEQPVALNRLLNNASGSVAAMAQAIRRQNISQVVIAARGTSDNAARYAQYALGSINGLTVALATPSLFSIYNRPPRFGKALVLGISQSGKSPDIVAVLEEARHQGVLTAALTNTPDSPLAEQGDIVIDLNAGPELAVAATKTYANSLGAIALLAATLAEDGERLTALKDVPLAMEASLAIKEDVAEVAPRYRYMEYSVVIGRGFNYATAYEVALKIKELTYTIVAPYSSADFLHGPMAVIEPGFPVLVIAPQGAMSSEMQAFARILRRRAAETIIISDDDALLAGARIPLRLPVTVPEWLSPLTAIIPGQLLAMYMAATRDYDVDAPRGLSKVTETR